MPYPKENPLRGGPEGGAPLAKHRKGAYKKGERRFLRQQVPTPVRHVCPPYVYDSHI